MEWLPIETAPRDGTWVLLKGGSPDEPPRDERIYPCVVGFWDESWPCWWFCWWDSNWRSAYENPTHWMPIPR